MDSTGQSLTICVSGAAHGPTVDMDYKIAFEIGKQIALRGHTLITGATVGLPEQKINRKGT
jgi:predicted Rossmann-fold nucleotide-binding protein